MESRMHLCRRVSNRWPAPFPSSPPLSLPCRPALSLLPLPLLLLIPPYLNFALLYRLPPHLQGYSDVAHFEVFFGVIDV